MNTPVAGHLMVKPAATSEKRLSQLKQRLSKNFRDSKYFSKFEDKSNDYDSLNARKSGSKKIGTSRNMSTLTPPRGKKSTVSSKMSHIPRATMTLESPKFRQSTSSKKLDSVKSNHQWNERMKDWHKFEKRLIFLCPGGKKEVDKWVNAVNA